jgi:RND superfamily putative drug exporter
MTRTDERQTSAPEPKKQRSRSVWVFGGLAIVVLLIGLGGGSFQSKLADVQKNDNSSFLPGSADSTKVANAQQKFSTIQSIPGFVIYQRTSGLTAADKAKITADAAKFRTIKGVSSDEVGTPVRRSRVLTSSTRKRRCSPRPGPTLHPVSPCTARAPAA